MDVGFLFDKVAVRRETIEGTLFYTYSVARQSKSGLGLSLLRFLDHKETHPVGFPERLASRPASHNGPLPTQHTKKHKRKKNHVLSGVLNS